MVTIQNKTLRGRLEGTLRAVQGGSVLGWPSIAGRIYRGRCFSNLPSGQMEIRRSTEIIQTLGGVQYLTVSMVIGLKRTAGQPSKTVRGKVCPHYVRLGQVENEQSP